MKLPTIFLLLLGKKTAKLELFVDGTRAVAEGVIPVNPKANPSWMAVGQERDAIEHPGHEPFDGGIARFLLWDRPLSDPELDRAVKWLLDYYGLKVD